ncbi:MAG: ATP-NAD kinase family protein [Candidatus Bathyarchaeota archaeon]|nr:ATP-NAD kinase family protein [Candidatus Bathyarchaeota archaeon]MDP7207147.1 ATP-NAD kinase family protein [Candidatus Bathyarchaeota archaeon]
MKKLGLIVNPVAGMGGRVGLKGTDGQETLDKARELGAVSIAPSRAVEALMRLVSLKDSIEIITYPHEMGEEEARGAGFDPTVIGEITKGNTTSNDTRAAAKEIMMLGVDLILFAGGDGTARDIHAAVNGKVPVLGIPAGVKIQSGVFAINPTRAGDIAVKYMKGDLTTVQELEVMDIDEEAYRNNRLSARLYGYLRVVYEEALVQGSKEATRGSEEIRLEAIASEVVEGMEVDTLYIIGPGTTTRPIAKELGLEKTLLGVDVIENGSLVASDVNEKMLLTLIEGKRAKIIVTIIGGQGFILGRGNQQISPEVIRSVGEKNLIIVASPGKLANLKGRTLLVDTGDPEVDKMLTGYRKVIIGYARRSVYKVRAQ